MNAQQPSAVKAPNPPNVYVSLHIALCFFTKLGLKVSGKSLSLANVLPFISLLMWTVVPCVRAAIVLPPPWTIVPEQSQPRSPTMYARGAPVCVNTARNLDWAGLIDVKDCAEAVAQLQDRLKPYGYIQWTFLVM